MATAKTVVKHYDNPKTRSFATEQIISNWRIEGFHRDFARYDERRPRRFVQTGPVAEKVVYGVFDIDVEIRKLFIVPRELTVIIDDVAKWPELEPQIISLLDQIQAEIAA